MSNTRENIFEKIKLLITEHYSICDSKIKEDSKFLDNLEIGFSSMDFVSFILLIEEEFEVEYNFDPPIVSVSDIVDYIVSNKNE